MIDQPTSIQELAEPIPLAAPVQQRGQTTPVTAPLGDLVFEIPGRHAQYPAERLAWP